MQGLTSCLDCRAALAMTGELEMRGNILITVLILLTVLSLSALYSMREGLLTFKHVQMQRDALQLELFVDEALIQVEQLLRQDPDCQQSSCLLSAYEPNFFLEQDLTYWLAENTKTAQLTFSWEAINGRAIIEHLKTHFYNDDQAQYFRATILLFEQKPSIQLRMQAHWKKTTLNGDIKLERLAVRLL